MTVNWEILPPGYTSSGCDAVTVDTESKGTPVTCHAHNADGDSQSTAVVKIDKTPPQSLTAAPERPADRNDWYVKPLTIAFSGTDPTSGLSSCTTRTYAGPGQPGRQPPREPAATTPATSARRSPFSFRYDATPPAAAALTSQPGDADATLSWTPSPDTTRVQLTRSPGVGGAPSTVMYTGSERSFSDSKLTNGVDYRYTLTAFDDAGNASDASTVVTPQAPPVVKLASKTTNRRLSKPSAAALARDPRRALLQRPDLPRQAQDPQCVAAQGADGRSQQLALPRQARAAGRRPLHLVRLARVRAPRARGATGTCSAATSS